MAGWVINKQRTKGMCVMEKTMDKIVALAKSRGFVHPGSEIYGGKRSWHSLQSIRGSEKPPRCPEATHVWGFIKMAQSTPTL